MHLHQPDVCFCDRTVFVLLHHRRLFSLPASTNSPRRREIVNNADRGEFRRCPAVREAAEFVYEVHDVEYGWVETLRYMAINHEVVPKERALNCLECHREGGRMDWEAQGYGEDPMLKKIR